MDTYKEIEIRMQTVMAELLASFRLTDEGMRQAEVVWRKLSDKDKVFLTYYVQEVLLRRGGIWKF